VIEDIFRSSMFGPYLGMRSYRRLEVRLSKGDRESWMTS